MSDGILDGVRIDSGSGHQRLGPGAVTYSVVRPVSAPGAEKRAGEKRGGQRLRTRLRSGKILTAANKFLVECLIHDVSARGARLHVSEAIGVPDQIRLYRDDDQTISIARVAWRKPSWVGIEFVGAEPPSIRRARLSALGGKFYAVGSTVPGSED